MRGVWISSVVLALTLYCAEVRAQQDELDAFFRSSNTEIFLCGATYVNNGFNEWKSCVDSASYKSKENYKELYKKIKQSKAKNALKEYYISLLSSLRSTSPEPGETKYQYDIRQAQNKQKLSDLASRVIVEMD